MQWSYSIATWISYGPNLRVFLTSYSTSNLLSPSLLPSWLESHHLSQLASQLHSYSFHFICLLILHTTCRVFLSQSKTDHVTPLLKTCEHSPISLSSPWKPLFLRKTDISWASYVKLQHISFTSSSPSCLNFLFVLQKIFSLSNWYEIHFSYSSCLLSVSFHKS